MFGKVADQGPHNVISGLRVLLCLKNSSVIRHAILSNPYWPFSIYNEWCDDDNDDDDDNDNDDNDDDADDRMKSNVLLSSE